MKEFERIGRFLECCRAGANGNRYDSDGALMRDLRRYAPSMIGGQMNVGAQKVNVTQSRKFIRAGG